ncbi:MAG: hypothetical protein QXO51_05885 [Halobacteria archaeon]
MPKTGSHGSIPLSSGNLSAVEGCARCFRLNHHGRDKVPALRSGPVANADAGLSD